MRIEARDAREAAVDDDAHAVDGQRGLGDVGGDDDLALFVARDGGVLLARRAIRRAGADDESIADPRCADG